MSNTQAPYDRYAPNIIEIAVAEILACQNIHHDQQALLEHRRRKLLEYPAELQDQIRAAVNERIRSRNKPPEPLELHGDPRTSGVEEAFFRQGRAKFGD